MTEQDMIDDVARADRQAVQAAVDVSRNRCEAAVKEGLLWYDRQQATEGSCRYQAQTG
ncbi:hypothetical protein LCGC14_2424840 [marine sediment metagenome]|uniref:Uncharacterized protein n=1 Tax=marine sediment metagenome TaxID=412755 RepID=A0A0F9E0Q5_9ZZZZ